MKYPTVTFEEHYSGDGSVFLADDGPDDIAPGTYVLVPLPEGERGVFIVTEGGEWPEDALEAIWSVRIPTIRGETSIARVQQRTILDALAEEGLMMNADQQPVNRGTCVVCHRPDIPLRADGRKAKAHRDTEGRGCRGSSRVVVDKRSG